MITLIINDHPVGIYWDNNKIKMENEKLKLKDALHVFAIPGFVNTYDIEISEDVDMSEYALNPIGTIENTMNRWAMLHDAAWRLQGDRGSATAVALMPRPSL